MAAAGSSTAAAETGAEYRANGTIGVESRQAAAAHTRPLPTLPDEKDSDLAALQPIDALAAPWQVRYYKWIIAALALAALAGLPALGAYLWSTWGPTPLDELNFAPPPAREASPAAVPVAPAAEMPVAPPPIAAPLPPLRESSRAAVTHTRRGESPASVAPARPKPAAVAPARSTERAPDCSEGVAALGLCGTPAAAKGDR